MTSTRRTVIAWFRRDLRLTDHPALAAADEGDVVAVFVDDPAFDGAGEARRAYLRAALDALNVSIGGALVVRRGDPVDVLPALAGEVDAAAVHLTRDHGPYGRRRDAAVVERLRARRVDVVATGSPYAVAPGSVHKSDGSPYRVFTPFARAWSQVPHQPVLAAADVAWRSAPSDAFPAAPAHHPELPSIGEAAAARRWTDFLGASIEHYATARNRPDLDATSHLSADLRWGVLHPSRLLAGVDVRSRFATELAWREFYADVLLRHPESAWRNLDASMDAIPVDTDAGARRRFDRWAAGTTGFPFVDAGMRQLLATGWMHNRARMATASFLVKDLHLPWQWGARHFLRHLIDGDLASNNHGWQWVAGTGTDAAPYFRVFNPTTQSEKFDPHGDYIRRWVTELADLDAPAIHAPPQRDGYPAPMADHAAERVEALRRYELTR
jgi:deoxyribodipyrimidine photo-lyase